jgi:Flp pilus assembly protein TadD
MKPRGDTFAIVNASRALLNQGDAVGAERVLSPMMEHLRTDPDALHLMAMIKKAQGNWEQAERYLRSTVAHALSEGRYYNDLGVVLQARGQFVEATRVFRAALALTGQSDGARVNLVRCLLASGEFTDAENEARAFISTAPSPESWTLLAQVQRAQEQHEQSLASAAAALELAPNSRSVQLSYAGALDRAGRAKDALAAYQRLGQQKVDSPELALALARGLYADGAKKDAEAALEQAIKTWPNPNVHGTLARMRFLRGEGEAATALFEAELAKRPADLGLRLACADALHRGGFYAKALAVLDVGLRAAPDMPAFLTAAGVVLDELDRTDDALRVLRRAVEVTNGDRNAQRNLLLALLRARRPEEAAALARTLRVDDPHEQYLIAIELTAMRMQGEAAYGHHCDYNRLVRAYEIAPPRGFFTVENFNASLADTLRHQHRVNANPLDQHMHNAGQTQRSLLMLNEPNLRAFTRAVDEAVRDYISRLDANELMGVRRTDRYRFSGLWSVRQTHEGYQANHVHDRGWISSAYYVTLLPNERPSNPQAGWLKFGEPHRPLPNCGPEALHEPREGRLVLFPSYMWHGTIPFEGSERLSLSFDIIPG